MKISVNAGHGGADPGAVGNGYKESDLARKIKDLIIAEGTKRGYQMDDSTSANGSTNEQADKVNVSKAELAISIHWNAGGGTGVEVYRWANASQDFKVFCARISNAIAAAYGFTNRGEKSDVISRLPNGLNFIRRSNPKAMLVEWAFIDCKSDVDKVLANPSAGVIALWDEIDKQYNTGTSVEPTAPVVQGETIRGETVISAEVMTAFVKQKNAGFDPAVSEAFYKEGKRYGIRGDVAFCQSIHETGWFKYGGDVGPEQHNYAGIGATGGVKGHAFATITDGVRAQLQHLWAYATKDPLPVSDTIVDPRFSLVTKGIAGDLWIGLNGRWAVPGPTYGQTILAMYADMQKFAATYAPAETPKEPTQTDPKDTSEYQALQAKYDGLRKDIAELLEKY